MAKARIVYVVDDKELKQVQAELKKIQKQNKDVAQGFGDSEKEIKKTGTSLADLKGTIAGLGLAALAVEGIKQFAKLTQEINKNRKETALLTKETGKALDSITAKIRATSQVFEKDYNEILRTANTLSKEFGISMTESLDEINEGFTRGLDVNGEYLETLREYSFFIKEAGLSTKQFNVLIQQQVQQGIFSDKGIDAIKEAVISIREMTPATKDAIKAIGIDTDQLRKDILSGTITYFEAVQQIATKTRELADPVKTGTILADVFRGAGEDAGNFIFTLDQVGESFGEVTEEQDAFIKSQNRLLNSSEDLNLELVKISKNFSGMGNAFKTFLNEAGVVTLKIINDLVAGFDKLGNQTDTFAENIKDLTVQEQADELANLESELANLESSLNKTGGTLKEFFKLSNEEKKSILSKKGREEAEENVELIKQKIEVLKQAEAERNLATNKSEAEINEKLQKEIANRQKLTNEIRKQAAEEKAILERADEITRKDPFEDTRSDFLKEVTAKQERNDLIAKQEKKLQDDLREINKQGIDDRVEDEEEGFGTLQDLISENLGAIADIQAGFSQLKIDQIGQEINALEFARNRELQLAEGNKIKEAEINDRFDQRKKALQRKQLEAEQKQQLFSIAINTAGAIVKGISQFGPPPSPLGIIAIAAAAAIGLAQAGLVLSQKPPSFAEGVLDLRGPGTGTSDSIHAMVSNGESVITAKNTKDYYPALKAIHNREISPDVLNNLVMNQDTSPGVVVYDYDRLAKAVMNQPQKSIVADEHGFTEFLVKNGLNLQKKQAKYKM